MKAGVYIYTQIERESESEREYFIFILWYYGCEIVYTDDVVYQDKEYSGTTFVMYINSKRAACSRIALKICLIPMNAHKKIYNPRACTTFSLLYRYQK